MVQEWVIETHIIKASIVWGKDVRARALWPDGLSTPVTECTASPWERDGSTGLMCHYFFLFSNFYFESPSTAWLKPNHSQRLRNFLSACLSWGSDWGWVLGAETWGFLWCLSIQSSALIELQWDVRVLLVRLLRPPLFQIPHTLERFVCFFGSVSSAPPPGLYGRT